MGSSLYNSLSKLVPLSRLAVTPVGLSGTTDRGTGSPASVFDTPVVLPGFLRLRRPLGRQVETRNWGGRAPWFRIKRSESHGDQKEKEGKRLKAP